MKSSQGGHDHEHRVLESPLPPPATVYCCIMYYAGSQAVPSFSWEWCITWCEHEHCTPSYYLLLQARVDAYTIALGLSPVGGFSARLDQWTSRKYSLFYRLLSVLLLLHSVVVWSTRVNTPPFILFLSARKTTLTTGYNPSLYQSRYTPFLCSILF